jgi:hypothetical protein
LEGGVDVETTPAMGLDAEGAIADPALLDGVDGADVNGDASPASTTGGTSADMAAKVSCPAMLESEP